MKRTPSGTFEKIGLLIFVGLVIYGGAIFFTAEEEIYVENEQETATTTETYPSEWLEEAESAFDNVIHTKKLEAERSSLRSELEAFTASTTKRLDEIDTELSF